MLFLLCTFNGVHLPPHCSLVPEAHAIMKGLKSGVKSVSLDGIRSRQFGHVEPQNTPLRQG
jgi:hypothetical protein